MRFFKSGQKATGNSPEPEVVRSGDSVSKLSIKILGGGCAKCNQLERAVKEAMRALPHLDARIEHVTDFQEIAAYGVMATPALVIDEQVVSYGKVLKCQEIVDKIENR